MIEISWQVAAVLLIAYIGGLGAFGKVLLSQFEKRMDERREANAEAIARLEKTLSEESRRMREMEQKIATAVSDLPLHYVRREDWVRFSATIDHKLDRLAELVMKQGGNPDARR